MKKIALLSVLTAMCAGSYLMAIVFHNETPKMMDITATGVNGSQIVRELVQGDSASRINTGDASKIAISYWDSKSRGNIEAVYASKRELDKYKAGDLGIGITTSNNMPYLFDWKTKKELVK